LYAGFAFISSLVREAIKDMEDLEGDMKYGCRTLPIVAGIRTTKVYVVIWLVVLVAALTILQLYILIFGWWVAVIYNTLLVIIPLVLLILKLSKAAVKLDFQKLSRHCKFIMLTGTLSMLFFLLYF
jgi:4-hydroxybenzoate polyprenyltransferase